jgi:CDP-paratose 2-epimerase
MNILITGGAGFTGCNCAAHFAEKGHQIVVFDDLSRLGSEINLKWLDRKFGVDFIKGDIRNHQKVNELIFQKGPFDLIIHLAAQVAVTTSVQDPCLDFNTNAVGTFNLLEAMRKHDPEAALIYSSTNKVYGNMEDLTIVEKDDRYSYRDLPSGIQEDRNLDFHSPYGCSKGTADQYCRDYARIYGLKTVVLRQSCIYGYRQFGIEDQGWVAWFCIANALNKPITIYGDGKQVRDILFIDDLIHKYPVFVGIDI